MTIQLPQELIEEILDLLAGESASLKTCSLICRAWLFRSRWHLFQTCTLHSDNILDFSDILWAPGCTFLQHICSINAERYVWGQNECRLDEIASNLHCLTNVHSLKLTLNPMVEPADVDAFFCTGFITAFPHVTRLVLTCDVYWGLKLRVPLVNMICLFPALEELHILNLCDTLADPPANPVPPRGLRCLALCRNSAGPILAWLHSCNHLSNVDSVTLPLLRPDHVPTVRAALQQLGGALHHLNISVDRFLMRASDVDALAVFDLALHPNLKTLAIHELSWGIPDNFLPLITRLVGPALECLSLTLHPAWNRSLNWAALDAFLSQARFPRLRSVVFKCRHHSDYHSDGREFLRGQLALLEASGVLRMEE